MASFGSGLVRTARTINLDKHRDERHSVDAATELLTQHPCSNTYGPSFNQLRKGSRVTPQLPVRRSRAKVDQLSAIVYQLLRNDLDLLVDDLPGKPVDRHACHAIALAKASAPGDAVHLQR